MTTFNQRRFIDALRDYRGERSYREAEAESGVNHTTFWQIERGVYLPRADTFATLCAWMNIAPQFFFEDAPRSMPDRISWSVT